MGQSHLPHLKERLLDYLLNENKAGTVVETAAHLIWERADDFVIRLENEFKLAQDPSRFEELKSNRDGLLERLETIRSNVERALDIYDARSQGGRFEGVDYEGYQHQLRAAFSSQAIDGRVVLPLLDWLRQGNNLKDARRAKFKTLSAQMEHQADEFVSGVLSKLHDSIEATETDTRQAVAKQLGDVRALRMSMTDASPLERLQLESSMTKSYMAFGSGGAALGLATGAVVGSVVPVIGTAIGAGIGGLLGVLGGLIARLAWSEERWIRKLEPSVRESVMNMLVQGGSDKEGKQARPVVQAIAEYLKERAAAFREAIQAELDNSLGSVQSEIDSLLAREEEIRAERDTIIARLDPKIALLHGLREKAEGVINETRERDTV